MSGFYRRRMLQAAGAAAPLILASLGTDVAAQTGTSDRVRNVENAAREIAAIMAGFRRGLEVLVAPVPKPINQTYGEDEMFIG